MSAYINWLHARINVYWFDDGSHVYVSVPCGCRDANNWPDTQPDKPDDRLSNRMVKANHVVKALHNYVFLVFGLPAIIHCDNGKEFVNKLIQDVVSTWPGHVQQLISGHPRHPQSQGLVEQAHYKLQRMMSAKYGDQSPPWTQWLPHIVCKSYLIILYALNVSVYFMCLQIQWTLRFMTTPNKLHIS